MTYKISNNDLEFLRKYATDALSASKIEICDTYVLLHVKDIDEFEFQLNGAVLDFGMDDEDTVNDIGKRLYNIYDELLYQKYENKAP